MAVHRDDFKLGDSRKKVPRPPYDSRSGPMLIPSWFGPSSNVIAKVPGTVQAVITLTDGSVAFGDPDGAGLLAGDTVDDEAPVHEGAAPTVQTEKALGKAKSGSEVALENDKLVHSPDWQVAEQKDLQS